MVSEAQPRFAIHTASDKRSVAIEFLPESGATGSLALTLNQLTVLIRSLGTVREQMVLGDPIPSLDGIGINAIVNTRWHIQPEPLIEGSILSFYHPGFGPVGFIVPRDQVLELVRFLTVHLSIQSSSGSRPN
jgi:hypothetical protein